MWFIRQEDGRGAPPVHRVPCVLFSLERTDMVVLLNYFQKHKHPLNIRHYYFFSVANRPQVRVGCVV